MNEHNVLNKDKIAEIETQAITDTATRWNVSEELVDESVQDYTEMIENFERYLNERYPDENMDTQPYVAMEIAKKVNRDIADKHGMDEGTYVVDVNKIGIDHTAEMPKTVEIQPGQTMGLDIDIDTGIR